MVKNLFDRIAGKYDEFMENSGQAPTLLDHISRATKGLEYSSVLDVGIGTGLIVPAYLKKEVEKVTGLEPSTNMVKHLESKIPDQRIQVQRRSIEEARLEADYELAIFCLSLAWMRDPIRGLEKALLNNPNYVIISDQIVNEEERKNIGKGKADYEEIQKAYNPLEKEVINALMLSKGYFPLRIFVDQARGSNEEPSGEIQTTLYTRTKPNTSIYEQASTIFQVNAMCNKRCEGCYAYLFAGALDAKTYLREIGRLKEGELIALRGGEPTLLPRWFETYVEPALVRGLEVAIETNGAFLEKDGFDLKKLKDKHLRLRISFDETHLEELDPKKRTEKFSLFGEFARKARDLGINFGFYALGMDEKQIERMLKKTELEEFKRDFHSLTYYDRIGDLSLAGEYIDVHGNKHSSLVNI